ncbi:MAG TPA: DinB family protein [Vicinamibacterales bacterium]|nr:DinB family protein [Vicinamibacterales bacterium]
MNEIARIVDQLEREHAGDPWHGSPLSQILDGITWEQAASKPLAGAHSIWELVLHMTGWKNEVRHRLAGARAGEPEAGDWPVVGQVSPERWIDAREKLELAHRLLVSAVKDFPEPNLFTPSNDARDREIGVGVSYYELLHGIVQHDAYHAGQIAILKKGV